jgi:hypothetical protein
MGYVDRYRKEAAERNVPNWQRVVIAQAGENTQEAIVARHGYGSNWPPELPLRFPSYETAFEWVERKLTQASITEVFTELRESCGKYYDDVDDVVAYVSEISTRPTPRAPDKCGDSPVQPELFDLALLPHSKFNTSLPRSCR